MDLTNKFNLMTIDTVNSLVTVLKLNDTQYVEIKIDLDKSITLQVYQVVQGVVQTKDSRVVRVTVNGILVLE